MSLKLFFFSFFEYLAWVCLFYPFLFETSLLFSLYFWDSFVVFSPVLLGRPPLSPLCILDGRSVRSLRRAAADRRSPDSWWLYLPPPPAEQRHKWIEKSNRDFNQQRVLFHMKLDITSLILKLCVYCSTMEKKKIKKKMKTLKIFIKLHKTKLWE